MTFRLPQRDRGGFDVGGEGTAAAPAGFGSEAEAEAFGEVCDLDWVNCFPVIWHSADGREWVREILEGELADISLGPLIAHGIEDLLVIVGGIEDKPYLASTRDLNNWDIYEMEQDLFDPHGPLTGLIEHEHLVVGVSGGSPGLVVNHQGTS